MSLKLRFQPRNDYVLIRRVTLGETPTGIAVADGTIEGVEHRVSAFGPDVKGLEVGDSVLLIGTLGSDYGFLPNSRDLLITKQQNVVLVYQ
jgi:hypothetical protein